MVVQWNLNGLLPGTTKTDPVARELANAVTALTDVSLAGDRRNEEKRVERKDEDKNIDTLFPGSKIVKLDLPAIVKTF